MKNVQFSVDGLVLARMSGIKTVTRRTRTHMKTLDVVYHGESLVMNQHGKTDEDQFAHYRADNALVVLADGLNLPWCWKRNVQIARFCPQRAARLFSLVHEVRLEPLQTITEESARAEGVTMEAMEATINGKRGMAQPMSYRQAFAWTWDAINGAGAWASNPSIYVIELGEPLTREQATELVNVPREERLAALGRMAA